MALGVSIHSSVRRGHLGRRWARLIVGTGGADDGVEVGGECIGWGSGGR